MRLVGNWLTAGVLEDGNMSAVQQGTPQGAVTSPLLANERRAPPDVRQHQLPPSDQAPRRAGETGQCDPGSIYPVTTGTGQV